MMRITSHHGVTLLLALFVTLSPCHLVTLSSSAADEDTARTDRAIERGLEALQLMQNKTEGYWRDRHNRPNPAVTGLAVMAFLSAGHVPGEGRYSAVVEKGIRWVLRRQRANGLIADDGNQEMYQHGIATLMLAEAAGMTDADISEHLRKAVAKAVRVILKAQRAQNADRGGWRYHVFGQDSDMSVTGWQVMALRAARNLGCDVPAESIDRAVGYIKRCHDNGGGGFRYQPFGSVTVACTGTSILALEIGGKEHHHCQEALRGGAYLLRKENLPHAGQEWFFYSIYYGSQAAFQLGGNYWTVFRPRLHDVLFRMQSSGGFWDGRSSDAQQGGRAYCTAMAILALTVEHRFLPIYQRGSDE
ncbi:MAG TPA: prenyltransferase/squalene oxidase repeat-containing protein [Gemmataceae bacterium]|nr:prenyltransferase/squalene oxidase repeat-containing protein [Gemmataceae bacterium]